MTASDRSDRTAAADALCVAAFEKTGAPDTGRRRWSPSGGTGAASSRRLRPRRGAGPRRGRRRSARRPRTIWYPLWDSGARLDHSVRTLPEMVAAADADLKVALGLLDVRHLAGDPNLTLRLRTHVLTALAPRRPRPAARRCSELVRSRHELLGELAHALGARPEGGRGRAARRDRAQGAGRHLAGRRAPRRPRALPAGAARRPRRAARRSPAAPRDRVAPESGATSPPGSASPDERGRPGARPRAGPPDHPPLAARPGAGSTPCWPGRPRVAGRARPHLTPIAPGRRALARARSCSTRGRRPGRGPAAAAARRGRGGRARRRARRRRPRPGWSATARRCPDPWPTEARDAARPAARRRAAAARRLGDARGDRCAGADPAGVGAGPAAAARLARSTASPSTGTSSRPASRPSALIRHVARPDVLMVAALLHDIGKGGLTEHSVAGEPIARAIATADGLRRAPRST